MDYSSLGTVTGACHAPVAGGQGKAPRIPVPIEKPADFEMDGREDFQNSLCLWAAALKQIRLLKGWRSRRGFCKVGTTFEPRQASAEAAHPVPPRRAHDTLQPQDESSHTHCLPDSKISETNLVSLRKINRNLSIRR